MAFNSFRNHLNRGETSMANLPLKKKTIVKMKRKEKSTNPPNRKDR